MKTTKIIYWVSTGIVGLMMLFSAYAYFTDPEVKAGFEKMGFHNYFRIELGLAKLIGAIVLLAPLPARIKEWAYAGFTITFVSAFIAHTANGDPVANAVTPIVVLAILLVSYFTYHKLQSVKPVL